MRLNQRTGRWAAVAVLALLCGCVGVPEGIEPVSPFDSERYLGRWYEIARLDHSFERGLSRVSAQYSVGSDGDIRVLNRGFNTETGEWDEAEGVASFVGEEDVGHLKVSFFGPFYGSYVVFELDSEEYSYSFVAGYNRDYLWLLAREPEVSADVRDAFVARAKALGFATDDLIWVDQTAESTTD